MSAADVTREVDALADPERAEFQRRVLGVVPGGYGEGDLVLGVPVPPLRAIARRFRDLPLDEVAALLASPAHEHRFVAVAILVERYRRADREEAAALSRFYLAHRAGVDNWDLVDVSAPHLLGGELVAGADRAVLFALADGVDVWDRRIAMVASGALIRRGDLGPTFALAERALADPHPLMHKAAGWMLREAGKRDESALVAWLERNRAAMPRTMLRYAVERLDPEVRQALMAR